MKAGSIYSQFARNGRLVSTLLLVALLISACQPAAAQISDPPTTLPTTAPAVITESVPAPTQASEATPTPTSISTIASTDTPPPPPIATPTPAFQEPTINTTADPKLGDILVGNNGMTLYIFALDESNKSNCDADCQNLWPPMLTQGAPNFGPGVDPSLVGTAPLSDGSQIVTYNQRPLYYWSQDVQPGDTTGVGIGNVWFVISPTGSVRYLPSSDQSSEPKNDRDTDY
jgi:predicted lipoprotein with Yx(FWY)xxD motif